MWMQCWHPLLNLWNWWFISRPIRCRNGWQRRPETIETVLNDYAERSNGKFTYRVVDPDAPGSAMGRQELLDRYGLQPLGRLTFFTG